MGSMMTLGVDHIGVGVTDMERSIGFWAELGFTDLAFDYSGALPGLESIAGRQVSARVVMLRPGEPTALGPGAVKLVELADSAPRPAPEGMAWGEPGVCEVCVHARDQEAVYRALVESGHESLMQPVRAELDPHGTACSLSYVADPDGTKIELIEWLDLERGWPRETGPQGVNHVAFGVKSLERTREFYRRLGFNRTLFDSDGFFEPMHPWFEPRPAPRQKMTLLLNPFGAGLEPVEHVPPSPDMSGEWGHLGPFDFGIGVRSLERAARRLDELGVVRRTEVQTVELGDGATWRYCYFRDPDDTYVCLTEARY